MTPGSFDFATARDVLGDARARHIEARARADADSGQPNPPSSKAGTTYWDQLRASMEDVVYEATFERRLARTKRKAQKGANHVNLWERIKDAIGGQFGLDLVPAANELAQARARRAERQRGLAPEPALRDLFAPPAIAAEEFSHGAAQIEQAQRQDRLIDEAYEALVEHAAGRLDLISPEHAAILARQGVQFTEVTAGERAEAFIERYGRPNRW